jgi:hypothetical protein
MICSDLASMYKLSPIRLAVALLLSIASSYGATTLSSSTSIVTASASSSTFSLTQSPATAWTANSSAAWLTVSPASGSGSQILTYTFAANASVNARTAAISVAGQTFSVLQLGSTGNYTAWGTTAYGQIRTIAGSASSGFGGDGSAATSASLNNPTGVAVDTRGNIFIADRFDYRIRRVDATTGSISTVAGTGYGFSGDGGAATSALLSYPTGVAVDSAGNLFISDTNNNRIRRVDAITGFISTFAGTGSFGHGGDGGPASAASLYYPSAIALDSGAISSLPMLITMRSAASMPSPVSSPQSPATGIRALAATARPPHPLRSDL